MEHLAGYIASVIIGISLGLIGGGGSILTLPVLVYLFHVDPVMATAYSLFIVGTTSLVGTVPKFRLGEVNLGTALLFGLPSIAAVYTTRAFILPAIPDHIFSIGDFAVSKSLLLMLLFSILMIAASVAMIRHGKNTAQENVNNRQPVNHPLVIISGALEGTLTGLVGAGGGFLIIPVLVVLNKLPMKQAIGTSLVIIAAKSLIGFTGDKGKSLMDWMLLLTVTGLAVGGLLIGSLLNRKVSQENLRKGFGWFVLAMGLYIILREVVL